MVHPAQKFKRSANGVKSSGKHSRTPIQFGQDLSGQSAISQNGIASELESMDYDLEKLKAELRDLEKSQLKTGEQMAVLLHEQVRLSEKSRAIISLIDKITSQKS